MLPIKADKYLEDTITLRQQIEKLYLLMGQRLKKIRDDELWKLAKRESFSDFLMEMRVSDSKASKLITIYEKFVLQYAIEEEKIYTVGWEKAYTVAGLVKSKNQAETFFENASRMFTTDINKEIARLRSGKEECEHEWNDYHFRQCKICKVKEKIYDQ